MWSKLARFSRSQLLLFSWFVAHPQKYATVGELSRASRLQGKSLGGVISSLARSKYRGVNLIEPWGRAEGEGGLRWRLNSRLGQVSVMQREIKRLLETYSK